ncbi:MAG: hypothetical protein WCP87_02610, partial [Atribacterota bacterium]
LEKKRIFLILLLILSEFLLAFGLCNCNPCQTGGYFCISTEESPFGSGNAAVEEGCPSEVTICKGESFLMFWAASGDVQSFQITSEWGEDLGTYSVGSASNPFRVTPEKTTEYTVTVKGQCEVKKKITVHVVEGEETAVIVAKGNPDLGYEIEIKKSTTSSKIMVKSIRSVQCSGSQSYWSDWSATKTNPLHFFDVSAADAPVDCIPLVGKWQFQPRGNYGTYNEKRACFLVTYGCSPCTAPSPTPLPTPNYFPTPWPNPTPTY